MEQRTLTRRLSPLDAFFLYIESPASPLHIGGVQEFDGPLSREALVARLRERIDEIPRYRQRVVPAPLGLGHPFWEDAPDFDPDQHVFEHQVPAPGGPTELRACAAALFEGMLPRDRPLWQVHLVHGLEGGRSGIVSKIHHAMVDGVSGVELFDVLFDLTPDGRGLRRGLAVRTAGPSSTASRVAEMAWDATAGVADLVVNGIDTLLGVAADPMGTLRLGLAPVSQLVASAKQPVARLPFNRPLTGGRRLGWLALSFAELRQVRVACEATLNDVIVSVVADGVGRYVRELGHPITGRVLRIMVPVNVRRPDEVGQLGNRVSIVPVEVPFDGSPVERVRAARRCTAAVKGTGVAEAVETLAAAGGLAPAPLYSAVLGLASSPRVLEWTAAARDLAPLTANLVCTNVPGPQVPIYAQGRLLTAHCPLVPLAFEFGLSFAVFSYNQRVYVGAIADTAAIDDLDPVLGHIGRAYADLRAAAGVPELSPVDVVRRDEGGSLGANATDARSPDHDATSQDGRRAARARASAPRPRRRTAGRSRG